MNLNPEDEQFFYVSHKRRTYGRPLFAPLLLILACILHDGENKMLQYQPKPVGQEAQNSDRRDGLTQRGRTHFVDDPLDEVVLALQRRIQQQSQRVELDPHAGVSSL